MKRCTSCGRAVDDSAGLVERATCPWCGGALVVDIAGSRTLADAVQVLWSVDPESPYDGRRAKRDLADLCPGMTDIARDIRVAGEVGALGLLRDGKAEAARRELCRAAHWDDGTAKEFVFAYLSLDPEATLMEVGELELRHKEEEDRARHEAEAKARQEAEEVARRTVVAESFREDEEARLKREEAAREFEKAKLELKAMEDEALRVARKKRRNQRIRRIVACVFAAFIIFVIGVSSCSRRAYSSTSEVVGVGNTSAQAMRDVAFGAVEMGGTHTGLLSSSGPSCCNTGYLLV